MSLNAALGLLLETYPEASREDFADNPVAEFVRKELPEALQGVIGNNDRYLVTGSAGHGNWARLPWVAVLDRLLTDTAQKEYYIVYLPREDFSGIYLSLNQGVTSLREQYGAESGTALRVRASDYLARLGNLADGLIHGSIDLSTTPGSTLAKLYEQGAICSIYYEKIGLPRDEELSSDLLRFLDLYLTLVSRETRLFQQADAEEDEEGLAEEDLRKLREHKRIERNKKLAADAKKIHGFKCRACGFDFEKIYGPLGTRFIEAHHLNPLSTLKGQKITLNPRADFTVLCANCHRMIHRSECVNNVEEFTRKHLCATTGRG